MTPRPDDSPPPPERIRAVLDLYKKLTGSEDDCLLTDLLADLAHHCDNTGQDFKEALSSAQQHYLDESEEAAQLPFTF